MTHAGGAPPQPFSTAGSWSPEAWESRMVRTRVNYFIQSRAPGLTLAGSILTALYIQPRFSPTAECWLRAVRETSVNRSPRRRFGILPRVSGRSSAGCNRLAPDIRQLFCPTDVSWSQAEYLTTRCLPRRRPLTRLHLPGVGEA